MPKRKHEEKPHPIDASGVLEAAKFGNWQAFQTALDNTATTLSFEDFNELPPGRSFGVVHQIAYHCSDESRQALERLLEVHPRVDLRMETKDGQTALDVAEGEGANAEFLAFLKQRLRPQSHHELVNKARDGTFVKFFAQLKHVATEMNDADLRITVETVNSVPPGRTWGILHQICYWGDTAVLDRLLESFPNLDLQLETNEEAPQAPTDIAIGRGHSDFAADLKARIDANSEKKPSAAASLVTAPSSSMKAPVSATGKLCNICYMDEHDDGTMAVACDNDHYICQPCFSTWVETESDIESNPQNILLNGGRITCVCKKSSGCDSLAYANKLIAMVVSDELYEKYLRARDYVVGKEAVAGALSKIGGDMDLVEQEQIRNMYRTKDGSYSAYMCGQCKFGPIDHGWCSNLQSHHGEKKGKGTHIDNACPKCKWFANDISLWPKWDGSFQSPSAKISLKPPPVASMTVQELKVALKSRGASVSGNKPELMARLQAIYDKEKN